jgi:hypothetical protein
MNSIALLSILAILGCLALLAVSVHLWWTPFLPVIVGVFAISIPLIAGVIYREKLLQRPNSQLLSITAFVSFVFGIALPGLWMDASIRAAVVPFLGERDFSKLQNDPAPSVHIAVCKHMFETGRSEAEIVQFIQDRPTEAKACMDPLNSGTVPLALTRVWQFELRDGGSCELATQIAGMTMVSAENRAIELLDCALSSRSSEGRRCCTTALKSLEQTQNLPFWISRHHTELQTRQVLAPLVLVSQEDEETIVRYDAQAIQDAGLTSPVIQGAALQAACQATVNNLGNQMLDAALKQSMATHSDCVDPTLTSAAPIADVCQIFLSGEPTLEAFCAANSQARRERAQLLEEARRPRAPSAEMGDVADAILAAGDAGATINDFMESKVAQPGARPLNTYSEAEKARFREQMDSNRPSPVFQEMIRSNNENLRKIQASPAIR